LVNARDGQAYFYDINALSNFVADAPNVVGFDPFVNLVDYLEERTRKSEGGNQNERPTAAGATFSVAEVAPV
jgi:hypothetical protein